MANIKLKDLINEIGISGMVTESPWDKKENDTPSINVNELVESIRNFNSIGESIYGKGSLKEIAQSLSSIAEGAAQHTLSETEDMFDKVTVSRNMKELTGLSKQFGKVSQEANSLQERMSGLYEDMGNILGRYYEIGEKHVPGHDDEDSESNEGKDMMFREDDGYKEFFNKAMTKFGIKSPKDLKPEDKDDFFNYVDRNYKAKNELKEYGMLKLKELLEEAIDTVPDISKKDHQKIEKLFSFATKVKSGGTDVFGSMKHLATIKRVRGNGGIASVIDMGTGYHTGRGERKGGSMFRLVISRNVPEKAYYVGLQKDNKTVSSKNDIPKLDDAIKYALQIGKKTFNKVKNEK